MSAFCYIYDSQINSLSLSFIVLLHLREVT